MIKFTKSSIFDWSVIFLAFLYVKDIPINFDFNKYDSLDRSFTSTYLEPKYPIFEKEIKILKTKTKEICDYASESDNMHYCNFLENKLNHKIKTLKNIKEINKIIL